MFPFHFATRDKLVVVCFCVGTWVLVLVLALVLVRVAVVVVLGAPRFWNTRLLPIATIKHGNFIYTVELYTR